MSGVYVDPDTGLPAIDDPSGVRRVLACLQSDPAEKAKLRRFSAAVPVMPESEWRDIDRRTTMGSDFILDQKSHGSCVGFGTAGALMRCAFLNGFPFQRLSGSYVYSFINGGRDQGANIANALAVIVEKGTPGEQFCGWDNIYPSRISAEARNDAANHKALECYVAETFAEMMTAIQLPGFIPVFAVQVGGSFTSLDSEGVCGFDRGSGNHCVHADGAKKLARGWTIDMPNSWNLTFGQRGRGRLTARHVEEVYQECFVIRAPNVADPDGPPAAQ